MKKIPGRKKPGEATIIQESMIVTGIRLPDDYDVASNPCGYKAILPLAEDQLWAVSGLYSEKAPRPVSDGDPRRKVESLLEEHVGENPQAKHLKFSIPSGEFKPNCFEVYVNEQEILVGSCLV